jgi:hypothetical protein
VAGSVVPALLAHLLAAGALYAWVRSGWNRISSSARTATDPFAAMGVDRAGVPVATPDLAFRSLDGEEVRLRGLRDKVVLLGFFTTT